MISNIHIENLLKSLNNKDDMLFRGSLDNILYVCRSNNREESAEQIEKNANEIKDKLEKTISNTTETTSVNKSDIEKFLMEVDTDIKFSSVILSEENKLKIEKVRIENAHADKFKSHGLFPINRLLFYGDSGCGKTYLGKALANELGYKMLYVDIANSLTEGNVSKNLTDIFNLANSGKYLLFLDEADSIAWGRDLEGSAETGDRRRVTNSLFQLMDQMSPDVLMVCATNMLHRLDKAFERRFNEKLCFLKPKGDFTETFKRFIGDKFEFEVDKVDKIIESKLNCSYYELQGIAERAMKSAIIKDKKVITMSDIYNEATYWKKEKSAHDIELE